MAGGLSPCDEVNHPEFRSIDWGALSAHEADLSHSEGNPSHPNRGDTTSQSRLTKDAGHSFNERGHQGSSAQTPTSPSQSINSIDAQRMDMDECEARFHVPPVNLSNRQPKQSRKTKSSSILRNIHPRACQTQPHRRRSKARLPLHPPCLR